jgi:hypothetical protein
MAQHRQGRRDRARDCFDRAVRWVASQQKSGMRNDRAPELDAFRAEAQSVLEGPSGELPDDVFGPAIEQPPAKGR